MKYVRVFLIFELNCQGVMVFSKKFFVADSNEIAVSCRG
jgi:hypothetical protein